MKKHSIILFSAILFILVGTAYFGIKYGLPKKAAEQEIKAEPTKTPEVKTENVVTPEVKTEPETNTENVSKQEPQQEEHRIAVEGDAEYELYDEMHKMANTKIIAVDGKKGGEIEITPEKCNELIEYIKDSTFWDKQVLLNMLNRWVKGDFHDAVAEHNYLWEALGGSVGRAIKLK